MGEVAADLFTDFPERFAERRHLFLLDANGSRRELRLQDFWPHKQRMVLKFEGIDSINEAEPLIGGEIQIPKEARAELEDGATYTSDLLGCRVFARIPGAGPPAETEIGIVSDVIFSAGEAPILEIRDGKKEHLVPLAQEYIQSLDPAAKRIDMAVPEGMLDLDAPLSAQEKDAQKNSNS